MQEMTEGRKLFQWLAENRLDADRMLRFLLSMGDFCTRTRDLGALPGLLRVAGFADEADQLDEIGRSEEEHGVSYGQMALDLLSAVTHPLVPLFKRDRDLCTQVFQGADVLNDPNLVELRRFAAELAEATYAPVFRDRHAGSRGVHHGLGVTSAIERVANEVIIPGEVRAFGPRGPYGLDLDRPGMVYLYEHAAEIDGQKMGGAEDWHHAYMRAIRDGLAGNNRRASDQGEAEAGAAIEAWFERLRQDLQEKPV